MAGTGLRAEDGSVVTVVETWRLKEECVERALEIMQEMDDVVGPAAHVDPGWREHGRFFQNHADPAEIHMLYTWRSRPEHEVFIRDEETRLADIYAKYCAGPRRISYFTELSVDVEVSVDHGGAARAPE
jgi:hypothetical protein